MPAIVESEVLPIFHLTIEKNEKRKVENFSKFFKLQNSCIEMLELMTSKHMVKMSKLPSFIPGPKILYTKSSSIGDILISRMTRITCFIECFI